MIESKKDYFELSRENSLPCRCPILEQCERRADTIALALAYANKWDFSKARKMVSVKEPLISSVGENAYLAGGENNFIMSGLCPEVSLFESSSMIGPNNVPKTKWTYDKFMNPQDRIIETGHFSECVEYSQWNSKFPLRENNATTGSSSESTYNQQFNFHGSSIGAIQTGKDGIANVGIRFDKG